jgi:hypothetical protein
MSKFAIGLLTLAMYAASLPVMATITPAEAATSRHIQKHKKAVATPPQRTCRSGAGVCPAVQSGWPDLPGPRPRHRLPGVSSSNR